MTTAADKKKLAAGYAQAAAITKRHAKTFYFASLFMPREKRRAAYSIYAVCRLSDDSVDFPNSSDPAAALAKIEAAIKAAFGQGPLDDPLLASFRDTLRQYSLPQEYFRELISGISQDLTKTRYASFAELYPYCYKVAGVIGLIMLRIFDSTLDGAQDQAVALGIAMQLTNIIRDIKEDAQRQRIYLPQDELIRFGTTTEEISTAQTVTPALKKLLQFQIERARGYYTQSAPGISRISDHSCRRVARLMHKIYGEILTSIENNNYDVWTRRACVPLNKKLALAWSVLTKDKP